MYLRLFAMLCLAALFLGGGGCDSDDGPAPGLVTDIGLGGDAIASDSNELDDASPTPGDTAGAQDDGGDAPQGEDTGATLDPALAESLQALLDEHVAFSADPGVTMTVRTGDGRWWSGAAGLASVQSGVPLAPGTSFRVGSNTKPFVAVVTLQLVEEGLVGLDDPLSTYFPDYEAWADITVRQLLQMRSGIPEYVRVPELMLQVFAAPGEPLTPWEVLDFVKDEPLLYAPGEGGHYTNSNYLLLGLLVEQVTGNPLSTELEQRIIAPLGLAGTFLDMTGEERAEVAHGYMDLNLVGVIFGVPPTVLEFVPEENRVAGSVVDTSYLFHPSLTWAAGALISNTRDMVTFVHAVLAGELLSPNTVAEMKETAPIELLGGLVSYGLGLQARECRFGPLYGHGGVNFGYQAGSYWQPELDVTFSHMHNFLPEQSDALQDEMLSLLAEGAEQARVPCLPPEDFFDTSDGPYLHVRFKGPVNAADAESDRPGVANVTELLGEGQRVPLYGLGSTAKRKQQGLQTRLEVTSLAPAYEPEAQARIATVSIDPGLLARLDAEGAFALTPNDPGAVFYTVAELALDAETQQPTQLCFTAVNDFTRPSTVRICDGGAFTGEAGQPLKLYGALALETDLEKVAATLATLQIPRCLCADETGAWGACP